MRWFSGWWEEAGEPGTLLIIPWWGAGPVAGLLMIAAGAVLLGLAVAGAWVASLNQVPNQLVIIPAGFLLAASGVLFLDGILCVLVRETWEISFNALAVRRRVMGFSWHRRFLGATLHLRSDDRYGRFDWRRNSLTILIVERGRRRWLYSGVYAVHTACVARRLSEATGWPITKSWRIAGPSPRYRRNPRPHDLN